MSHRVFHEAPHGARVPVHVWATDASPETLAQLSRLASMPYVVEHVAAMADAHMASGVAVGSVFATADAVVPGALGSDIGCGMSAIPILGAADSSAIDRRCAERILEGWSDSIPVGDATRRGAGLSVPAEILAARFSTRHLDRARDRLAPRHLGTLGGGNHFVELDHDAVGSLWLLVHSGSRGVGGAVGHHHSRATGCSDALAPLSLTEPAGLSYVLDHGHAVAFARANRSALAKAALEVLSRVLEVGTNDLRVGDPIDVPHNFVRRERWFERDVLVHRKGAAPAFEGTLALVPGSMGTASYIVEGRGCPLSFGSCSHGAGRVMSRREARAEIRPETLLASMRRVVFPAAKARALVEEAPAAYRDIRKVLEAQSDLVTPKLRLEPILVLKG